MALAGENKPVETIQTGKCGAESDGQPAAAVPESVVVKGKMRLPDEYLGLILSMPREKAVEYETEEMELPFMTEERRQLHREGAARSKRIRASFAQFQMRVLEEFLEKGYVEMDDDYLTNMAESEKEGRAMWEESRKKRNPILTFAARDDPNYACFYAPFDPVKQAESLLSDLN
jgi:hypothetical protein